jgi:hypothetical protein
VFFFHEADTGLDESVTLRVERNLTVHSSYLRLLLKDQIPKIITGGQTGADRAALDFALERGISHGGWCPKGRLAEDGTIHARYQLIEAPNAEYVQRTEWNARDSDGTVIFSVGEVLAGGSKKTEELARKHGKPVHHLSRNGGPGSPETALRHFIEQHNIKVLNVAGPRASQEPEVGAFVKEILGKTWQIPSVDVL